FSWPRIACAGRAWSRTPGRSRTRGGGSMKSWMVLATLVAFTPPGHAQHAASASNMALLGHHDLQGRSAYQPVLHEQNGRWIAYVGHHGGRARKAPSGRVKDW